MSADCRLVLFDIDGTLLSVGVVFRRVLSEALLECFGRSGPVESFDFSGMTDPQIIRCLMRAEGLEDQVIDARMQDALARYEKRLLSHLDGRSILAKPGAIAFVEHLTHDKRIRLGLLTGNLERCARAKLEPLGLNALFGFGAFGSDHEDRNRLPAIAVERASQGRGDVFDAAQIVIVGDSVQDVRCGRGFGARTIAVASGKTTRATLAAEEPDVLLDDLLDAPRAHHAIMNE